VAGGSTDWAAEDEDGNEDEDEDKNDVVATREVTGENAAMEVDKDGAEEEEAAAEAGRNASTPLACGAEILCADAECDPRSLIAVLLANEVCISTVREKNIVVIQCNSNSVATVQYSVRLCCLSGDDCLP
jgi:hypothetical protein